EMLLRLGSGEEPSLEEYLRRFPQHGEALRRSWPPAWRNDPRRSESGAQFSTSPEGQALDLPAPAAGPPLSLPGLELYQKLGEGGMGAVFRARDLRLDQPRAIKVIRRGILGGGEANERFTREAKAAARLDHEGVVRIYALGEQGEVLYLCMEYLEGGSLQARL